MASLSSQNLEPSPSSEPAFRVRSEFGAARKWRSRKSRPCDVCRRRKTACIIETAPPCLFCKTRGLPCESSERSPPLRKRRRVPLEPPPLTVEGAERHQDLNYEQSDEEDSLDLFCGTVERDQRIPEMTVHNTHGSSTPFCAEPTPAVLPSPSSDASSHEAGPFETQDSCSPSESFKHSSTHSPGEQKLAFHDGEQRTAHSIGLSGEQDTNLLASLRSIIMNEHNAVDADVVQVFPGDPGYGEPPIHFSIMKDDLPPLDRNAIRESSDTIESLVGDRGPRLVSLYFKNVHPMNCLVSKGSFLRSYYKNKLSISASLRGVIYGLGFMSSSNDPAYSDLISVNLYSLFQRAHNALLVENHLPNLWTLQAAILLVHERPGDNFTTETPRTWILSAQAVASAQVLGLHRDPKFWNIPGWEKHVRRKLWWATYVSDVWTSVCHGNPPHISNGSFTTSPLQIDEFSIDEHVEENLQHLVDHACVSSNVTANARFVESVKLSRILRELLDSFYSDQAYKATIGDPSTREAKLFSIEKQLDTWMLLLPSCVGNFSPNSAQDHTINGPLHLAYFAVKALLYRALMWPTTTTAKADPKSALRRFFDKALSEFGTFFDFVESIDSHSLKCFWGAHARSQLVLCGNFLVFLFLMAPTSDRVQTTFRLLESVYSSLKRSRDLANNEDAIALLRPALLRIETLFTQASRIMDTRADVPIS